MIVALGAFLRLFRFGSSPPGLNQDEAVNAWNAWCLLRTGRDMTGASWPVFYSHAIGDNRTTLYFYALLPFQALGGLSVVTTRLPNAIAGIACVPLAHYVGARLHGRIAGLVAALAMAVSAWPVFLSRWGIEGGLCPLLAVAPVALLIAARLPVADRIEGPPRPWVAALAGLVAGVACYGYWPMRLWIPALFAGLLVAMPGTWRRVWSEPRGRASILALVVGLALTAGPLALRHVTDPAIARRAESTRLWTEATPLAERALLILDRWISHYGPAFLFGRGDHYELVAPPGEGEFGWTLMPWMVLGLAATVLALRRSRSARLLAVLVAIYPAGDLVARYLGPHALRSAPGIPALALLAGAGAAWLVPLLRVRAARVAVLAGLVAGLVVFEGRGLVRFFGPWNQRPAIFYGYQADVLEAARWLRPRLAQYDAVFCTTTATNLPFAVMLVGLNWDPRRWFAEPRDVRSSGDWDVVIRHGSMHYLYADLARPYFSALEANGRPDRVLLIVRPGESRLGHPVAVIPGPPFPGRASIRGLEIYEIRL